MSIKIRNFIIISVLLILTCLLFEKYISHHSFEKFFLGMLQRIDYNPQQFSDRITIIDTSPIYDIARQRTDHYALARLLKAIKLGEPQIVGLDIRLEIDSLSRRSAADSLLKDVVSGWDKIIVPQGADPFFEISNYRLANIKISDGYEVPLSNEGYLSLPFQMADHLQIPFDIGIKAQWVYYRIKMDELKKTKNLISADELLKIYENKSLDDEEKQDKLALNLASQIVFVGFCNDALNIDKHETPFGRQPGIIIWANAMHDILRPFDRINYAPFWGVLLWTILTALIILKTAKIYAEQNFFYPLFSGFSIISQTLFWLVMGSLLFFSLHIYFPIFSLIFVAIGAFPAYLQFKHLLLMAKIAIEYPKIRYLPAPLKKGYIKYLKQSNPFKKLHIGFTLIEECIRFSALLGLAQAMSVGIDLNGVFAKQKWDRKRFSRLTFGEWHNIMRTLARQLKNNDALLYQWKLIYLEKNKKRWKDNDLLRNLDNDLNALDGIHAKKNEMINLANSLNKKPDWSNTFNLFIIKLLSQKNIRKILLFFSLTDSKKTTQFIEQEFGNVQHLIQLRNRMVHDGGAFMKEKEVELIYPKIEPWIKKFFYEKFRFWKDAQLAIASDGETKKLKLKIGSMEYCLSPFFELQVCEKHFSEEIFSLRAIYDKQKRLVYFGKEHDCRIEKQDNNICENIFEFLGIEK